MSIDAKLP